jgi:regulator of protease activity HflC (stomatin/prohibitin superfamily)
VQTKEQDARVVGGAPAAAAVAALAVAGGVLAVVGAREEAVGPAAAGIGLLVLAVLALPGFLVVQPNQATVLIVLGRYRGSVRRPGWFWANSLTAIWRRPVSLRVHNFAGDQLKVNDAAGNPIEIAAVVVWRVVDTARAVFDVEDYRNYVEIQSEAAIRHLANQYPYEAYTAEEVSLRGSADEVAASLHRELGERLEAAGVEVLEARLTHLAYAPEIAEAMLRRQQAGAIVAARATIVDGAVGMVEQALLRLERDGIVDLDGERRAAMISNMLVVLTSDRPAVPVVNAGSLYT